jgi:hypothetical protein
VSEPKRPSHGDWDAVLETDQLYEAELAALRLREAGFEAQVVDESFRQEPLPVVRSFARVRVLVPAERASQARDVLAVAVTPLPEDAEDEPS